MKNPNPGNIKLPGFFIGDGNFFIVLASIVTRRQHQV